MAQSIVLKDDLLALGQQAQSDAAADDSDKSFTVPAGEEWTVTSVFAQLASTATVGNRRLAVEAQDGSGNALARSVAGAAQAASLTRSYTFAGDVANQGAFVSDHLTTALPRLKLGPGMVLRVYDLAAVDAAADDLTVRLLVDRRGV